jgi:hypothetical protein
MRIDEAGRDRQPVGIDHASGPAGDAAKLDDATGGDCDVGAISGSAASIDDGSVANQQIMGHPW